MIQIHSKVLTKAMQLAASALPANPIVPVMEYVKFEVMGRIAYVTGIGGEMSVRAGIEPDEFGGSGEVSLPANLVLSAIEGLDTILTVKKDSIAWDNGRLTFGASNDPYPEFSMGEGDTKATLDGPGLSTALSKVVPLLDISTEMSMYAYAWIDNSVGCVYGGGYNAVGQVMIYDEAAGGVPMVAAISKGLCGKVGKLLKDCGEVKMSRSESTVFFRSKWIDFSIAQPAGEMPRFAMLLEKSGEDLAYFDSCINCKGLKALVGSIESTFGHCTINLNSIGGILTVTFQETMGGRSLVQSLPMTEGADDWSIMFSSSFLGKQLNLCDTILIKDHKAAVRTSGPGYKGLVMPQFVK